jgi:hypothetical protein
MICLPIEAAKKFLQGLKDGTVDPNKLSEMTSEERNSFFKEVVGEKYASATNALLESKLLLKDQQRGMITWAKEIGGMKPDVQRDIVSKINKLDRVLNPTEQTAFLHDLASQKLGTDVTMEEAQKISQFAKESTVARTDLKTDPTDKEKQIAFGNKYLDLTQYVDSLKPKASPFTFSNIVNLPKSMLTSVFHFSASFVQGWGMMTTKPFWEAFGHQFRYYVDPQAYRDLQAQIIAHPDYELAKDGKLGLTALGDKLTNREEAIQSSLLEHVPGLNVVVKASSRAFTGMLNDMRFGRFVDLLNAARLNGEDVSKGSSVVRDLAKTVNDFTGRGALGTKDRYASIQPVANTLFFSPRKLSATIEMFDPVRYLDPRISPTARLGALRQLSGSLIATGVVLSLARLAGASVNFNPTDTDFMKIRIGNTTFDMTGGNAIYIRLLARLISGQMTSTVGKTTSLASNAFGASTRMDQLISFLRGKLSPTASSIADALYGKDQGGQPFNVSSEAYNKLVPIVIQQFINLATSDPNGATWIPSISAIFGVGMETSVPVPAKSSLGGKIPSLTIPHLKL